MKHFTNMHPTKGYAAKSKTSPLAPFSFKRRDPGPTDIQIDILFCGVCHSDFHTARGEWSGTTYPCVPGHEIVGRIVKVGRKVKKFCEGDLAAVGCMVDSCRTCDNCRADLEQFCDNPGPVFTYNSKDKHTGGVTYGGYSKSIVVDQDFVLRISDKLDLAATAPLLCALITTYSPLRHWKIAQVHKVGVVGLGGLGHMGVKFANAFGANVALFTTSPNKTADAKKLGAHEVILSKNEDEMEQHEKTFDFILDTVSAPHDIDAYLSLLKRDGTLVLVGASPDPLAVDAFSVIHRRRSLAGSLIGGVAGAPEKVAHFPPARVVCATAEISIDP